MTIQTLIRTIPHYPKPGVMFRDITTLLKDPAGLQMALNELAQRYRNRNIAKVAGIEARGFILGAPLAYLLGTGFVPIRKSGKLPGPRLGQDYTLEYGKDRLEIHCDAIEKGERVVLVDDLIATGGTAQAAVALIEKLGGELVECAFAIDLPDLGGSQRLREQNRDVFSLCDFSGH